jgi:hypothetical protein
VTKKEYLKLAADRWPELDALEAKERRFLRLRKTVCGDHERTRASCLSTTDTVDKVQETWLTLYLIPKVINPGYSPGLVERSGTRPGE